MIRMYCLDELFMRSLQQKCCVYVNKFNKIDLVIIIAIFDFKIDIIIYHIFTRSVIQFN